MLLLIVQVLVMLLFLAAGMTKLTKKKSDFDRKMPWAKEISAEKLRKIGMYEILGALGVTLPIWLDVLPWVATVAAVGLLVVALMAFKMHLRRKERGSVVFTLVVSVALLYLLMNYGLFF